MRHMTPVVPYRITVSARGVSRTITRDTYDEQRALHRPWVKMGLSRVALHMMHDAAKVHLNGALLDLLTSREEYQIPSGLAPYVASIRAGTPAGAARRIVLRNYRHVSTKDGPYNSAKWIGHPRLRNAPEARATLPITALPQIHEAHSG
ncbi:hypothetical protein SAMN04488001_0101 [Litoreibacter albidus]|uniref:Uncharacterized protein n=2 Tax=Litoreibacter albidus TaxID=670155 RepID=A0A1H3DFC9_9RHOB|nr:hypothetical protein SAMN04488001_0101 [Litoreibacter albidus]